MSMKITYGEILELFRYQIELRLAHANISYCSGKSPSFQFDAAYIILGVFGEIAQTIVGDFLLTNPQPEAGAFIDELMQIIIIDHRKMQTSITTLEWLFES